MRVFLIVIDGLGVGELPDAAKFGDVGSNTFENLHNSVGLDLPTFKKLGLYNIDGLKTPRARDVVACYGRMAELSMAKDTTAGHWEIACAPIQTPFVTFPSGFDDELIKKIEEAFGTKTLANCVASGTEIINKFGKEHLQTGYPICYTSADSDFQIACHEDIYSNEQLYKLCEIARKVCSGKYSVGRVIARPFNGKVGQFVRTSGRRDFSLSPPKPTIIDKIKNGGHQTIGIGKIEDIFPKDSLTSSYHTTSNKQNCEMIKSLQVSGFESGLLFSNLVDSDMLYGHRNDTTGYKNCLTEIDKFLADFVRDMKDDDVLAITADHGNDPTTPSTDHSREYVPVLMYGKNIKPNVNLGTLPTFQCLGYTILDLFNIEKNELSFKEKIINEN